jgi:hypothetical protein
MIDDGIKPIPELHALFTPANKSEAILASHPQAPLSKMKLQHPGYVGGPGLAF